MMDSSECQQPGSRAPHLLQFGTPLKTNAACALTLHTPPTRSLYVEEVDLGEETTRTVVSGLVKHIPEAGKFSGAWAWEW